MISTNYNFMNDFYEYKWILEELSIIEERFIIESDYNAVLINSYTILEKYFKNILGLENSKLGLGKLVGELKEYFRSRLDKRIDYRISNLLDYIVYERNARVHGDNNNYLDTIAPSFNQCITILKHLKSIFSYFIFELEKKDVESKPFDEEIYFEKSNKGRLNYDNVKEFDDPQIDILKVSVGNLVLDKNKFFIIPPYQRDYRWTIDECSELLKQIIDKMNSNELVYFGSIACKYTNVPNDRDKFEIKLIDGQQRITTSLILFKALFDVMKRKELEENNINFEMPDDLLWLFDYKDNGVYSEKRINEKYQNYTTDRKSTTEGISIILRGYNNRASYDEEIRIKLSKNQVYDNYMYFYNELKSESLEDLEKLYKFYYNKFIFSCITFDSNDNNNEMEIFENLNSKGKDLDTFDMIKNYIFNTVEINLFRSKSKEFVMEFSKYFRLSTTKTDLIGDEANKKYEEFLYNYITYLNATKSIKKDALKFKIQKNKRSLLKGFKSFYDQHNIDEEEYYKLCSELGRYFYIYKTLRVDKVGMYMNSASEFSEFGDIFKNISHKDFTVLVFYLVDVYSDKAWNKDEKKISFYNKEYLREALFEIEKWSSLLVQTRGTGQSFKETIFVRLINYLKSYQYSNDFKSNLPKLMRNWFAGKSPISNKSILEYLIPNDHKLPTYDEIINSFKNNKVQNNALSLVFLTRIEKYWINSETKADQSVIYKKMTVEHIMPQKLTDEWKNMLTNGKKWDSKFEDKYNECLDKIGNYLLLDSPNNSELKNISFYKKKQNYSNTFSRLAKIPFNINDENLITIDSFTFNDIDNRSAKLAQILLEDVYEIKRN